VDFFFEGHDVRGVEQSPDTNNRWARLVRSGKKVMQFLRDGRYVASVVDGKIAALAVGSRNASATTKVGS
jgi:hypothetical protein